MQFYVPFLSFKIFIEARSLKEEASWKVFSNAAVCILLFGHNCITYLAPFWKILVNFLSIKLMLLDWLHSLQYILSSAKQHNVDILPTNSRFMQWRIHNVTVLITIATTAPMVKILCFCCCSTAAYWRRSIINLCHHLMTTFCHEYNFCLI